MQSIMKCVAIIVALLVVVVIYTMVGAIKQPRNSCTGIYNVSFAEISVVQQTLNYDDSVLHCKNNSKELATLHNSDRIDEVSSVLKDCYQDEKLRVGLKWKTGKPIWEDNTSYDISMYKSVSNFPCRDMYLIPNEAKLNGKRCGVDEDSIKKFICMKPKKFVTPVAREAFLQFIILSFMVLISCITVIIIVLVPKQKSRLKSERVAKLIEAALASITQNLSRGESATVYITDQTDASASQHVIQSAVSQLNGDDNSPDYSLKGSQNVCKYILDDLSIPHLGRDETVGMSVV